MVSSLVVPLLVPPPAAAMDCEQARTAIEKTICADPLLKAQDAALSRLYFDTLRGLHGERHDLLIADQRRWLADQRTCEAASSSDAICVAEALRARRRTIAICFAGESNGASALAGKPIDAHDYCTILSHLGCPDVTAIASARLVTAYPWLVGQAVAAARRGLDDDDCSPAKPGEAGPGDNEAAFTMTLVAERPGMVSVRHEDGGMSRGAAHPWHDASLVTYDTRTRAEIGPAALMPAMKPGSKLLATLSRAAAPVIDAECCGGENHSFKGLGLEGGDTPMPSGWAPAPEGRLTLGYVYMALGRNFLATAVIPHRLFIESVDPRYVDAFGP